MRVKNMKNKILMTAFIFGAFQNAHSITMPAASPANPTPTPTPSNSGSTGGLSANAFVKYTCRGIITPGGQNDPEVFANLLVVYFPAKTTAPFPSVSELAKANPERFKFITKECNKRRIAATIFPSGRPANWPDWQNDRKYQRIDISEVVMPANQRNRAIGDPCQTRVQCGSNICNADTLACDVNPLFD